MKNYKANKTLLNASEKLSLNDGAKKVEEKHFRNILGSLMYLTCTRPNIVYSVNLIFRFTHSLSKNHVGATKRILHYI